MSFDYAVLGHVTVDILPGGRRRVGGTALYSAIQAARLGLRTVVATRGVADELEALLRPFEDELELRVEPSARTTSFETAGVGPSRRQRMAGWAGKITPGLAPEAGIVHMAPVADEIAAGSWPRAEFVGLTPRDSCAAGQDPDRRWSSRPSRPNRRRSASSVTRWCSAWRSETAAGD